MSSKKPGLTRFTNNDIRPKYSNNWRVLDELGITCWAKLAPGQRPKRGCGNQRSNAEHGSSNVGKTLDRELAREFPPAARRASQHHRFSATKMRARICPSRRTILTRAINGALAMGSDPDSFPADFPKPEPSVEFR